jgi:hypothetical protein
MKPHYLNRFITLNKSKVQHWKEHLPLSKKEKKYICKIKEVVGDNSSQSVKSYKYGKDFLLSSILISREINFEDMDDVWIAEIQKGEKQVFPLSTSDFLKYYTPSGKLGEVIIKIENEWLKSNFELNREQLLERIQSYKKI